jgi:UAA transporter family
LVLVTVSPATLFCFPVCSQEAIYAPQPNEDGTTSKFAYTLLMLFGQAAAGVVFSFTAHSVLRWRNPTYGSKPAPVAPTSSSSLKYESELDSTLILQPGFTACAAFYLLAMACSNESLRFVSYPFQSLAKSCKLIPVMISRVFLLKANYSVSKVRVCTCCYTGFSETCRCLSQYVCVFIMSAGIARKLLNEPVARIPSV